ncbi:MAG: diacylglycerol/lipid kinase family protein [Terriglobales bacterium]
MRALALLGPNAAPNHVAPFESVARQAIATAGAIDASDPLDAVLIFGGDGTVHRHLRALVETQVPALVVPSGSGNDFARALGLQNRDRSLAAWRQFCDSRANVRTVDVGQVSPTAQSPVPEALFCCVAGAGIDSEVNRRANRLPGWLRAHGGYALSVPGAAASFQPRTITVEFVDEDGRQGSLSEPALMCAFANASAYGHGMRVAPGARMDDGLLDLIFVRRASPARLLTLFPTIYFGAHLRLPEVEHRRVTTLTIVSDPPLDIYADGEFICRTPASVKVRPRALKVISGQ